MNGMLTKKIIMRCLFVGEIGLFAWTYVYGRQGIFYLQTLAQENRVIESEIEQLRTELVEQEKEMLKWEEYPFYKEKIAREHLQLAREQDEIYYLT
jgi:cell division protein FtsB